MKFFKTSLTALLAIVIFFGVLSLFACSNGPQNETGQIQTTASGQDPGDGPEPETETAQTEPAFNFKNYGGEDFIIYFRSHDLTDYQGIYIIPSDDDGDVVSQEAVRRNLIVEDKFNIKIKGIEVNNPYTTLLQDVNSGERPYDLMLDRRRYLGPLCLDGALVNLKSLEADYTTHWWDAKAAYGYSVCGKLFLMPNDVSISNLGGCRFFFFNKEVLENFNLTSPYDYAGENNWTLETFTNLIKAVSAPNADGTLGIYGLVNEDTAIRNHCLVGCGIDWVTKVDEDKFEVRIGTDFADRAQDYLDRMKALLEDESCVMEMTEAAGLDPAHSSEYAHKYDHSRGLFAQGHFLFTHTSMDCAYQFADMKKGYGVIMNPKYNSDQADYYHRMDSHALIFAIPKLSGIEAQKTVDILDYWGYVASSTSMEAFYELTLKTKRATDPTAAEMLDTVKASICYPISDIFATGNYTITVGDLINLAAAKGVSLAWKTYSKTIPKSIDRVVGKVRELAD